MGKTKFLLKTVRVQSANESPDEKLQNWTMKFAISVHGAPFSSSAAHSAYRFAEATLDAGHKIARVFFYHDAVRTGDSLSVAPQEENTVIDRWAELSEKHEFELAVCIAASLKRGVINDEARDRYEKPAANLHPAFTIVGLGQLIDAIAGADRFISFGA